MSYINISFSKIVLLEKYFRFYATVDEIETIFRLIMDLLHCFG